MPERQSSPGEVTARPETDVTENSTEATPPVADQVSEQVVAAPGSAQPGPVEPAADTPTGDEPVVDGAVAADVAQPGTDDPERAAAEAPTRPTSKPAPRPSPRPSPAPDNGTTVPAPGPRPRPRPRPDAEPAGGGESPTVRTPAGGEGPTVPTSSPAPAADAPTTAAKVPGEAPTVAVRVASAPAVRAPSSPPPGSWFSSADVEATQVIPRTPAPEAAGPQPPVPDPPTERLPVTPPPTDIPPPDGNDPGGSGRDGRSRKRGLIVVGAVLVVLALVYLGDLLLSSGAVPRGVAVAGVQVGGLGMADAEQRLRQEIEPRTGQPVAVTVGEATSELDPATAGLSVDWRGTLDQAGSQPLNPITRITSFFTEREVGVVTTADPTSLIVALEELSPIVDKAPVEGTVRFEDTEPIAVDPVAGQQLDVPAAGEVLRQDWATGRVVALPLTQLPPTTTPDDVAAAIEQVARPAVSEPVKVIGEGGVEGTITPETVASALTFRAEDGALVPEINPTAVSDALEPQLASSERPGRDASLDFSGGATPVVIPSQDGRGVDYEATLRNLLGVLTGPSPRQITAVYADEPAELTTDELNALGITGVIGEFQTGGFAADSGRNIRRAAEQINGMIVDPGETFSLNEATVPRNAANGYVEAGIINEGQASRGIAGGVSQVATTLYNASYFAGMVDVRHQEHSFFISRYPPGREATVFEGSIDLRFRNDNPTGVLIQTAWTPSSLTVKLFGTKVWDVTSTPGPRTNPTTPKTVTIPAGEPCSPSNGAPGFTISDVRTLRNVQTGEVRTEPRSVRYNPSPIVVCGR